MVGRYKSVLEKYNETVKPRLPTAEEEAIQPDTTLESLFATPARAAIAGVSALKSGISKAKIPQVEIGSKVKSKEESIKKWTEKYGNKVPHPFQPTPAEIAVLKEAAKKINKKIDERQMDDSVRGSAFRMGKNLTIDSATAINNDLNRTTPMGDNFKKGGKVSASSRADGIAQRGKTRGKMC